MPFNRDKKEEEKNHLIEWNSNLNENSIFIPLLIDKKKRRDEKYSVAKTIHSFMWIELVIKTIIIEI